MSKRIVLTLLLVVASCASETSNPQALDETGGALRFEIVPGDSPDDAGYTAQATVAVNGKRMPRQFNITARGFRDEYTLEHVGVDTDDTFTVSASFTEGDGAPPVSCERTWIAVAPGSIGCSPVEIAYHHALGTCQLSCD